jgi:hypothetical protein
MIFKVGSSNCQLISNPNDVDYVEIKLTDHTFKREYDTDNNRIVYHCNKESLLNYLKAPSIISDWGILAEPAICKYLGIKKEESKNMMRRYLWHVMLKLPKLPPKRLWPIAYFLERTDLVQEAHDLKDYGLRFEEIGNELKKELKK